jgi:hypothetical protein
MLTDPILQSFITAEDVEIRERMDVGELSRQISRLKPSFHLAAITGEDDQIAPPKDMEQYKKLVWSHIPFDWHPITGIVCRYIPASQVNIKVIPDAGHTFKSGWELEMLGKYMGEALDEAKGRWEKKHGNMAKL